MSALHFLQLGKARRRLLQLPQLPDKRVVFASSKLCNQSPSKCSSPLPFTSASRAFIFLNSVSLTPDGKWALTGSGDRTARLWDFRDVNNIRLPLQGHTNHVTSVSLTPDGKWALTGSDDTTAVSGIFGM